MTKLWQCSQCRECLEDCKLQCQAITEDDIKPDRCLQKSHPGLPMGWKGDWKEIYPSDLLEVNSESIFMSKGESRIVPNMKLLLNENYYGLKELGVLGTILLNTDQFNSPKNEAEMYCNRFIADLQEIVKNWNIFKITNPMKVNIEQLIDIQNGMQSQIDYHHNIWCAINDIIWNCQNKYHNIEKATTDLIYFIKCMEIIIPKLKSCLKELK